MNVHFIATQRAWRVVETLTDPTAEQVEKTRARLLAEHNSIAVWHSDASTEEIEARLRQRRRAPRR